MNFFRYDSGLMETISRMADLAWLNILCVICSIPIITSGAAISAKYYTAMKLERGEAPGVTRAFFHSFKENFVQDLMITAVLIFIYAFFIVDWYLVIKGPVGMNPVLIGMLGIFSAMISVVTFCIFPLVSRFEMKNFAAFRNSLVFGVVHLPSSVGDFYGSYSLYYKYLVLQMGMAHLAFISCVALYYNSRYFIKKFDELEEKTFGTVKKKVDTEEDDLNFTMNFEEYDKTHNYTEKDETTE